MNNPPKNFNRGPQEPVEDTGQVEHIDGLVPKKCEECPVVCDLIGKLATKFADKNTLNDSATKTMGDPSNIYHVGPDNHTPTPVTPDQLERIRKTMAYALNTLDEDIRQLEEFIKETTSSCTGVAVGTVYSSENSNAYDVKICTSRTVYPEGEGEAHLPAHVTIQKKEDPKERARKIFSDLLAKLSNN